MLCPIPICIVLRARQPPVLRLHCSRTPTLIVLSWLRRLITQLLSLMSWVFSSLQQICCQGLRRIRCPPFSPWLPMIRLQLLLLLRCLNMVARRIMCQAQPLFIHIHQRLMHVRLDYQPELIQHLSWVLAPAIINCHGPFVLLLPALCPLARLIL